MIIYHPSYEENRLRSCFEKYACPVGSVPEPVLFRIETGRKSLVGPNRFENFCRFKIDMCRIDTGVENRNPNSPLLSILINKLMDLMKLNEP
jgi:hypothetical protein